MPSDEITNGIARLALISGAAVYGKRAAGPVTVTAGSAVMRIPGTEGLTVAGYLGSSDFASAVQDLSEAVAEASLERPREYLAFLDAMDRENTVGHVLLRPASGAVPDAAAALVPWLLGKNSVPASARIIPALPLLDLVSAAEDPGAPLRPDEADAWCEAHPESLLLRDGPAGSLEYAGWNASLGRAVSVLAPLVDFEKPWRVTAMPDGSEETAPASPMRPVEPELGYWEPVQP